MASLRDIRKRIRSVKNTRQITKAMKMVAAAKLRKAQEAIIAARPYANTLDQLMGDLVSRAEDGDVSHPLLKPRDQVKKIEVLVLTSDRGLAGGFNANITRRVQKFLAENNAKYAEIHISTAGRKGNDFLRNRGQKIRKDHVGLMGKVTYVRAAEIADELAARYLAGDVDAVFVVYNEFVSAIAQVVRFDQVLPFETKKTDGKKAASSVDYLYEPNKQAVLDALVPQALKLKIYRSLLDSVASEHGSRMSAMENATKNAGEMIGSLTLHYNRTRQAAITKELMEIVSGAEALK